MRILITGAGGFLGGRLVQRLAPTHEVTALVRRTPASPNPAARYVEQDLSRPLAIAQLPAQLDAIIHQAALIDGAGQADELLFRVNVIATWELLRYAQAAGCARFIHASTGGVYGCRNRPFVESDPYNPMDLYSLTKAQAELAVQAAPGDFHRVVLRYFFPYGVGTPNPIPQWVRRALSDEPLPVSRSGVPRMNPLHVDDAVEATVAALQLNQHAVVNIAGNEVTTIAALAQLAATHAGRQANLVTVADDALIPYYRADLVADTTRMRQLLRFSPSISLSAGIAELARDANHHPS